MGLDVTLYQDAEPYHCPCLKKDEVVAYWNDEGSTLVYSLDAVDDASLPKFRKTTFESYDADDCDNSCKSRKENEDLKTLGVGGISHYDHDRVFRPGQVIKYQDRESFYFGGYHKLRRVWEDIAKHSEDNEYPNAIADMHWSEGVYTGKFLYFLQKQLREIAHLSDHLESYKDLLDTVTDVDFLEDRCVLIHS